MRSRNKKTKSSSKKDEGARQSPSAGAEKHPTVIGASLQFVGEIKSGGSVRIEGRVKGKVAARRLTVGPAGGIDDEGLRSRRECAQSEHCDRDGGEAASGT